MMRSCVPILALFILVTSSIAQAEDGYYEARLANGKKAYAEQRMPDAATDLRIAAFGYLDRPASLTEALVWLALAESANGRTDKTRWALTRFVEVETRFQSYRQLPIDPSLRKKFEQLLLSILPSDTIASVPTLAELVATPVKLPAPAPARTNAAARATPQPSGSPPLNEKTTAPPREARSTPPHDGPAPTIAPNPTSTTKADAATTAAREVSKARKLLQENRNEQALAILDQIVERAPTRVARVLLLHAATRSHRWSKAVAQIPFVRPFANGEEVTMFYAAVALYRTGNLAEARTLLERALPGINTSSYVESYKQKILGR